MSIKDRLTRSERHSASNLGFCAKIFQLTITIEGLECAQSSPDDNPHPRLQFPNSWTCLVHLPRILLHSNAIPDRVSSLRGTRRTKSIRDGSTRTYQDSHFCSHDVPGASRSELDADCRRFLAFYTRHTFAFATRGPLGPGPQVVYPHVVPLCSTTTTTTVPPSERPPLPFGTDVPLPLLTLPIHSRAPESQRNVPLFLSRSNERVSRLFLLRRECSCPRCLASFFSPSHIFASVP